jgi:hypothetical protein
MVETVIVPIPCIGVPALERKAFEVARGGQTVNCGIASGSPA